MTVAKRVLVVEDSTDVGDALADMFVALGTAVAVARTGTTALEIARFFKPQLAFIDIQLPDIDGYELAMRLRALAGPELRLLAISGHKERTRTRSLEAGFEEHLVKPVSVEKLRMILHAPQSELPRAGTMPSPTIGPA